MLINILDKIKEHADTTEINDFIKTERTEHRL